MQWLASQGVTYTNYFATTHPSEPNYCAVVGGDNFGMDNDDFNQVPSNVSTVVDLLDTKGISWAEYEEGMPYAGYQGYNFSNQTTYANDYVRKHNPLILYESVTSNATRLSLIKNFTSFYSDLAAQTLPQWSFITPNMTDDGHDTTITFAANWARTFLEPLLNNTYFTNNTLILLTFDEADTYTEHNNIFTIALGGAIPANLKGTNDSTFYNHYSALSSVSVNWGLPSLGRWDCNANVFQTVANATNYNNYIVDTTNLYFNASYPGPLSDDHYLAVWPQPAISAKCAAGQGVLGSIASTWKSGVPSLNYSGPYPYDQVNGINIGGSSSLPSTPSSTTGSGSTPTSSGSAAATSSKSAAVGAQLPASGALGLVGAVMAVILG